MSHTVSIERSKRKRKKAHPWRTPAGAVELTLDHAEPLVDEPLKIGAACSRCRLPPRWCVCAGARTLICPLQVDVLTHYREVGRPSSTGGVICRTLTGSRQHLWRSEQRFDATQILVPGRELWILDPSGLPIPKGIAPEAVQVLLLDGSWREATSMARKIGLCGKRVALPMSGKSRFQLRAQHSEGRFSTVEALLFLLKTFGMSEAHSELQIQFELHVYAGLRARGRKEEAREFLNSSPLGAALPELLSQLNQRRPALSSPSRRSSLWRQTNPSDDPAPDSGLLTHSLQRLPELPIQGSEGPKQPENGIHTPTQPKPSSPFRMDS